MSEKPHCWRSPLTLRPFAECSLAIIVTGSPRRCDRPLPASMTDDLESCLHLLKKRYCSHSSLNPNLTFALPPCLVRIASILRRPLNLWSVFIYHAKVCKICMQNTSYCYPTERSWMESRSPYFIVFSCSSEGEARLKLHY